MAAKKVFRAEMRDVAYGVSAANKYFKKWGYKKRCFIRFLHLMMRRSINYQKNNINSISKFVLSEINDSFILSISTNTNTHNKNKYLSNFKFTFIHTSIVIKRLLFLFF